MPQHSEIVRLSPHHAEAPHGHKTSKTKQNKSSAIPNPRQASYFLHYSVFISSPTKVATPPALKGNCGMTQRSTGEAQSGLLLTLRNKQNKEGVLVI